MNEAEPLSGSTDCLGSSIRSGLEQAPQRPDQALSPSECKDLCNLEVRCNYPRNPEEECWRLLSSNVACGLVSLKITFVRYKD